MVVVDPDVGLRRQPACGGNEPAAEVSEVTFAEVNVKFGVQSDRTDLQKEREWPTYEGLCVEWAGELTPLSEELFGGFDIQFKHLPTTFVSDVLVHAPASAEEELLTWRERKSVPVPRASRQLRRCISPDHAGSSDVNEIRPA